MTLESVVEVAALFVTTDDSVCARLAAQARLRDLESIDEAHRRQLDVLDDWLEPTVPPDSDDETVTVGILDYHQPDQSRASTNVGDYVQTLAMLGNLARFSDCTFTGEQGLGELMTELQGRVRPELRQPGVANGVRVVPVNRDFSSHDPLPPTTWTVAFGWHMHSLFRVRHDFPYHPHVRPLFVSFHVNRPEMLTDTAVDYLRRWGPVGCRDWTTVDLLLSAGVDAFFTGCVTTTVNTVFPDRDETGAADRPVGLVDAPPGAVRRIKRETEVVRHGSAEYREASLAHGVHAAVELLGAYQRRFSRLLTSRLHAYLPACSLGVPVRFDPKNLADVRFEGLLGMSPGSPELSAMSDGIRALLAGVLGLVISGANEETVYAGWRELTASGVAEARARRDASRDLGTVVEPVDQSAVVRAVAAAALSLGPHDRVDPGRVTDVALSLDQNLRDQLPVTLEALHQNATEPLRLWITCRGLDASYQHSLSALFPELPMTFLPCDHVDHGELARMISHVTVTTMDRLLLPELLPDLNRVTYVDIDAVFRGDVCELARTDLQGTALAARTSLNLATDVWRTAGLALPPDRASELRRLMAARHAAGVRTLNAGILVLDLARMRADRFSQTYLPFAERFGLNDQDVLLAYVGGDRAELGPRWNGWPVMEDVAEAAVVHYLGPLKPWGALLAPGQEHWEHYAAALAARAGQTES
jgi:lipopolysaccharide biosynthesis glycosyltransferase